MFVADYIYRYVHDEQPDACYDLGRAFINIVNCIEADEGFYSDGQEFHRIRPQFRDNYPKYFLTGNNVAMEIRNDRADGRTLIAYFTRERVWDMRDDLILDEKGFLLKIIKYYD